MPNGLKTFLGGVKSEILDPKNRNKINCNLPREELQALQELIKLQRERIITIKPCDKGAGIIILNCNDYMLACYEHLESRQDKNPYYSKVGDESFVKAKKTIQLLIEEGLDHEYLNRNEFQAMIPEGKNPSRFYRNFKVHKNYEHIPPVRPIVSGSGSITENVGKFVAHHLKEVAEKHDTF